MPKISEAYLYKTYFAESRLSDPPKYRYGKRRTLVSTSYAIVQQADTPRLGREKVDFKSGEIDLRQIDFRNAQVTLKASREIRTGTTTSFIKTGADPDHLSAGRQVQFWYGSQVSTGAGADSIVIDHTTTNAANYLGDIMLVGGQLGHGRRR